MNVNSIKSHWVRSSHTNLSPVLTGSQAIKQNNIDILSNCDAVNPCLVSQHIDSLGEMH